jgi:hypothetical protein
MTRKYERNTYDFIKENFEIEEGIFVDYSYDIENGSRIEECHGTHFFDESEVTDFRIDAIKVMIGNDFALINLTSLSDEMVSYIQSKLTF